MNYEQAMEVIQKICEKLNVAAEYLVPKMAAYKITSSAVQLVISAAIMFIAARIGCFCFKEMVNRKLSDPYDAWPEVILVFCSIAGFFMVVYASIAAVELATWIAAPEAKLIEYVIHLVR